MPSSTRHDQSEALAPVRECDVLVLGGSFTGIELVRRLHRDRQGRRLRVVVIDRQRDHLYIPLGHELLCERLPSGVAEGSVLASARFVEQLGPTLAWLQGELVGFDAGSKIATLADGRRVQGRFVVVALGSELRPPAHFPGCERLLAYKSEAEFARAKLELAHEGRVLVVGGGITGVEIAGELAHAGRAVTLVEGAPRLLRGLHERASRAALAALRAQKVEVLLGARLTELDAAHARVRTSEGERDIPCTIAFWAGGLQPPPIVESLGLPTDHGGWLIVDPQLRCSEDVFAGGDVARVYESSEANAHWPTMQRAIEGIFAAKTIAHNLLARLRGRSPRRHRLWRDFPHGVSIGAHSLVVYGSLVLRSAGLNIWFRRFLMRQYMRRYS